MTVNGLTVRPPRRAVVELCGVRLEISCARAPSRPSHHAALLVRPQHRARAKALPASLDTTLFEPPLVQRAAAPLASGAVRAAVRKLRSLALFRAWLVAAQLAVGAALLCGALLWLSSSNAPDTADEPKAAPGASAKSLAAAIASSVPLPSAASSLPVTGATDLPAARTRARAKRPKHQDPLVHEAASHVVAGRYADALRAYEQLQAREANNEAYASMVKLLSRQLGSSCAGGRQSSAVACPEVLK